MPKYQARDSFVVIRRRRVKRLVRGFLHVPENNPISTDFIVESIGAKVENLKVGDEVMIIGKKDEAYFDIPGETDYFVIDARLIPYSINRDESEE